MDKIFEEAKVLAIWELRWASTSTDIESQKIEAKAIIEAYFNEEFGIFFAKCQVDSGYPDLNSLKESLERIYYKADAVRRAIELYDKFCEEVLKTIPKEDSRTDEQILEEYKEFQRLEANKHFKSTLV